MLGVTIDYPSVQSKTGRLQTVVQQNGVETEERWIRKLVSLASGWLKMTDMKMTDHQNCRTWNCRTWICGT